MVIDYRQLDRGIEISVTDHGRGIKEEHIEKMFERFEQADPTDHDELGVKGLVQEYTVSNAISIGGQS